MRRIVLTVLLFGCAGFLTAAWAQQVTTVAGLALTGGSTDGTGAQARFNEPHALTCDKNGNTYIADRLNHKIRKVTPAGVVTTIAGTGTIGSADGPALSASFNEPWGICSDTLGNLYIADTKNYKIRKLDATGNVTTIAGTGVFGTTNGPANTARFGFPAGIAVSRDGLVVYVADYNTHVIRKIENGQVSTLAGTVFVSGASDGSGTAATFNHPYGIFLSQAGNLLVADEWNNKIRSMTPAGTVSTLAGTGMPGTLDGPAAQAQFNAPSGISMDTLGNIFVCDALSHTIRKISSGGTVSTYAGYPGSAGAADGNGSNARFNGVSGIAYNPSNRALYAGDKSNHLVRKIVSVSSIVLTLTASGNSTVCPGVPISFTISPAGLSGYSILENGVVVGSSANPGITINNLSPGNHTLMATAVDANGATASSNTINVTILPAFVPQITSSGGNSICNGASLTLTAQSGTNYLWSGGATTPSITVSTAGTFSVSVTNASGCRGTSAGFTVTVQSTPTATVSAVSDSVCPGQSTSLSASSGSAWLWSNGATTQSITAGQGTYTVTVTGSGGCTAVSAPQLIGLYPVNPPVITPNGTLILIQGDSILLQAAGSSTYLWSNGSSSNSVYVSAAGTYSVTGTSANGCTATSAPVTVSLISTSSMISAQGATSFCDGSSVELLSIFPDDNQWYYDGMPVPGATAPQFTATEDGWYYVSIWQNNSWYNSDSIRITVYPRPDVPAANDTNVCAGASVQLILPLQSGITYRWYDAVSGGNLLSTGNTFITPVLNNPAVYFADATNTYGCTSDRLDLDVIVKQTPTAAFTYEVTPYNGQYNVQFNCATASASQVNWIFGDTTIPGNSAVIMDPAYIYPAAGYYTVTLIVSNSTGCSDTLVKKIFAGADNPVFVPTTFTPNGDGKNDVFRVRGEQFTLKEMRIYDQWGSLIFTTDASAPQWDGQVDGRIVPNATYVYRIVVRDADQQEKELTGPVTVIK